MNDLKEIGSSPQRQVMLIVGEGLGSFRPHALQYIHSHHRYLVCSTSSSSIHKMPTPTTPQNQHKKPNHPKKGRNKKKKKTTHPTLGTTPCTKLDIVPFAP